MRAQTSDNDGDSKVDIAQEGTISSIHTPTQTLSPKYSTPVAAEKKAYMLSFTHLSSNPQR